MYIRVLFLSLFAYPIFSFAMEVPNNTQEVNIPQQVNTDQFYVDINNHFIPIQLNDIESDLNKDNWIEIMNSIVSELQNTYHPHINALSIDQFKKDIVNQNEFSISNLRKSLKSNFGIGHLFIVREKFNDDQILDTAKNLLNTTHLQRVQHWHMVPARFCARKVGCEEKPTGYLYTSPVDTKDLYDYLDSFKRISVILLKSENKEVPLVTAHSFSLKSSIMLNDIATMTETIGKKYDHIILDLRGNEGGDIAVTYYFLSLLLGNNDPDIYPIPLSDKCLREHTSHTALEDSINSTILKPFYELITFGNKDIIVKKNVSENITFTKMIILVGEKTFSGGEVTAATLKNTLGSKVCILGKPCVGSFEKYNDSPVTLPHNFKLHLPESDLVFYSQKHRKLLTGYRLLPDIRHDNMDTIIDKALEIIDQSTPYPEAPSYERTIINAS